MAKASHLFLEQAALVGYELQFEFSQLLEHCPKVDEVLLEGASGHQDIIDIYQCDMEG